MSLNTLEHRVRMVESEIENKLTSFRNLLPIKTNINEDDNAFELNSEELRVLLDKLADMNDTMSNEAGGSSSPSPTVIHTLQRHRDVLNDYAREYRKTKANLIAARDRTMLLSDVQHEIRAYKEGFSSGAEYYESEQARLNTAHSGVDDAIGIAIATREDLQNQRNTFRNTSQRLQGIAETIPGLNVLMRKIDVRKKRDQLIISGVISVCLFLSLIYTFG
eukprot:CFRG7740T1